MTIQTESFLPNPNSAPDNPATGLWEAFVHHPGDVSTFLNGLEYSEALVVTESLFGTATSIPLHSRSPAEREAYIKISVFYQATFDD